MGYGAKYLAEAGIDRIIAVDRDPQALQIALKQFYCPVVTLSQDDCHTLVSCAKYAPFDAVVSFETVEHLPRPAEFLTRCRELLIPGGLLVISTPNRQLRNSASPEWEFHEREYTAAEFVALLVEAGFSDIALYGQQFTALGKLRNEVRAELNKVRFNPVVRTGRWLQKVLRGHRDTAFALPERVEDFEIIPLPSAAECDALCKQGPFVLVCLASS